MALYACISFDIELQNSPCYTCALLRGYMHRLLSESMYAYTPFASLTLHVYIPFTQCSMSYVCGRCPTYMRTTSDVEIHDHTFSPCLFLGYLCHAQPLRHADAWTHKPMSGSGLLPRDGVIPRGIRIIFVSLSIVRKSDHLTLVPRRRRTVMRRGDFSLFVLIYRPIDP